MASWAQQLCHEWDRQDDLKHDALRDLNEILVEQGVRPTSFAELAELGLELEVIA